MAALVVVPLGSVVCAGMVESARLASALYYAAVIALAVMLIESLLEVRGQQQELTRRGSELADAADVRRLAGLMSFVGETSPTAAELAIRQPEILDGWLELVAARIRQSMSSGYASVVLLREVLSWSGHDFIGHYEVFCGGGADQLGLGRGARFAAEGPVDVALAEESGAEGVYFSEFSFNSEPYWLCVLVSTSAPHPYLETLSSAMVAPMLVALVSMPPDPRQAVIDNDPYDNRKGT